MPSWARASMIRRPAVRTFGFTRCASTISRLSTGSLKLRHHSSCRGYLGTGGAAAFIDSSEPPVQASSQGTLGRLKSGPTVVQALTSSALASATAGVRNRADLFDRIALALEASRAPLRDGVGACLLLLLRRSGVRLAAPVSRHDRAGRSTPIGLAADHLGRHGAARGAPYAGSRRGAGCGRRRRRRLG